MDFKKQKAMSEAYDKLYDLDSICGYKYNDILAKLEDDVREEGYTFVLNDSSQKFKCKRREMMNALRQINLDENDFKSVCIDKSMFSLTCSKCKSHEIIFKIRDKETGEGSEYTGTYTLENGKLFFKCMGCGSALVIDIE